MNQCVKKHQVVIVGLGESAILAYEYFTHDSEYEVIAFSADDEFCSEDHFLNLPVIKLSQLTETYSSTNYFVFVAVSSTRLNRVREALYLKVKSLGYRCASYVSSRAFVWHNVNIGENCFILEDNTLQPFTEVGNNVVMWSGNHLGHRSVVHDHCFIASHVVISGFCEIGSYCFIGVNAAIADYVKVARDSFIGMGAIVSKSTLEDSVYTNEPAKKREKITAKQLAKV